MDKFPKLNFPSVRFQARRQGGKTMIWDALRKSYLVLTPEEWVRQHLIAMLINDMHIAPVNIIQEYPIDLNGQSQRADVVVLNTSLKPSLLIECKAPDVELSGSVLEQAVRYNSVLGATHIILTNGLQHAIYTTEDGINYSPTTSFPSMIT